MTIRTCVACEGQASSLMFMCGPADADDPYGAMDGTATVTACRHCRGTGRMNDAAYRLWVAHQSKEDTHLSSITARARARQIWSPKR